MEDDFDFDEFMEESNSGFNSKLEEWRERMMIEAIEQNYNQIKEKGISEWHLRNMEQDEILALQGTLDTMLKHYEELEEFEKCALIKKELDKVIDAVSIDI
jgi:hypothetical protein